MFFLMIRPPPRSTLFPSTTLFRSEPLRQPRPVRQSGQRVVVALMGKPRLDRLARGDVAGDRRRADHLTVGLAEDRKSTRLNSSHANISYPLFCLKNKKPQEATRRY